MNARQRGAAVVGRQAMLVRLTVLVAVFGAVLLSGCASVEPLRPGDSEALFTVETLRKGGVLVPLPYEESYVESGRKRQLDGSRVRFYRFRPPPSLNYPVFLESAVLDYWVPGQASYNRLLMRFQGMASDAAEEDRFSFLLPGEPEPVDTVVFRDASGNTNAFILNARTGNQILVVAMGGVVAADPEYWGEDIGRILRVLRAERGGSDDPGAGPTAEEPG